MDTGAVVYTEEVHQIANAVKWAGDVNWSRAVRRATEPANGSLACWLDQKVRSDESLYVHLQKGEAWPQPHRTGVDQNGRAPFCQPVPGDWGPCII